MKISNRSQTTPILTTALKGTERVDRDSAGAAQWRRPSNSGSSGAERALNFRMDGTRGRNHSYHKFKRLEAVVLFCNPFTLGHSSLHPNAFHRPYDVRAYLNPHMSPETHLVIRTIWLNSRISYVLMQEEQGFFPSAEREGANLGRYVLQSRR